MSRLKLLQRSLRWLPGMLLAGPGSKRTVAELIERHAARRPEHVFVRFEGRSLSYGAYNTAANRVAHWALEKGFGRGDVIALLMENRPEYLEIWAGLAKTGATIALLNTNVSGRALAHVLEASQCRALILGAECVERWEGLGDGPAELAFYVAKDPGAEKQPSLPPEAQSFDKEVAGYSAENPPRHVRAELRGRDPLFYIYTSGTTGLPKAARFSHSRFMGTGMFSLFAGFGRRDTMYCALPLYHTAGGAMAVNAVLRAGATLALRRRFSATRFWSDVAEMNATCFQYIGEVCRYLLAQPPSELDRAHRVRFCVGNGLRPDIWETFQERFAIPDVIEFYGATESNVAMVNLDGRVGSVGKPTPGTELALVRYDVAADTHVRDAEGHCVRCSNGEVGELLGRIAETGIAAARFEGYTSKEATEKKVLRDVFAKGDAWFRTGDLLRCDQEGFYYFVDRLGDTFRWKGENVSTQEVAEALGTLPGIELCSVFGVEVPGSDGRAGMAALVLDGSVALDGAAIFSQVEDALPAYSRPVFLRVQKQAELTGTLKLRKVDLQRQGFDPGVVTDPLYYRDDQSRSYRPLNGDAYARIRSGTVRF